MVNKKAQDLSIGTLILIVLGIIVLVLLILGFSIGWANLWEKIGIFGGSSSISDVVTACSLASTSNANFDYCNRFHKLKIDGKTEYINCQDSRVSQSLDTELTCTGNPVNEQCAKLTEKQREGALVNGALCLSTVKPTCNTLNTQDPANNIAITDETNCVANSGTALARDLFSDTLEEGRVCCSIPIVP